MQLLEAASRTAATDQISIANSVGSLRFISAMDWGKFVEELSLVEHLLRLDPAGVYASQDFPTRDRYRHAIEAVARGSCKNERDAARAAIALAQASAEQHGSHDRSGACGLLPHRTRAGPRSSGPWAARCRSWCAPPGLRRPFRLFLYLAPILLLSALAAAFVVAYVASLDHGIG